MHAVVWSFLLFSAAFAELFHSQRSDHDEYYYWTFGGQSRWKSFLLLPLVFFLDARYGLETKLLAHNILRLDEVNHPISRLIVDNDGMVLKHGKVELLRVDLHVLQHVLVLFPAQPARVPLVRVGDGRRMAGRGGL